ncbi:peptidase S8/S53 domain-containing protein [Cantharellus anzutake]|uniref:peptidase S8/S53 domain-containing protein n=1 Tax=Cantharellus anzutake TaxID=1750568 RepID=UPI001908B8BB|nr:peptidase S8/S53 domain-containing protein [Cantharellus anzutake]KAF8321006.1 peptidase S8/S53 domain-containing protein [Cantharellus anzutake]
MALFRLTFPSLSRSSPRWTEHLTKEEVEEFSAPHSDSIILLESFLIAHGIDITGDALEHPQMIGSHSRPPLKFQRNFSTQPIQYMQTTAIRTTSYSFPAHLHDHIDVVQPTNFFPSGRPLLSSLIVDDGSFNQQSGPAPAPVPQPNMSLPELKTLYRTDAYKAKGTRSSIGITEKLYKLKYDVMYLEQYANLADLKQFFYRPALKSTLHVELINGAINSQNISEAGIEADLDVQFAGGISVSYLTSAQWGFRATQSPLEICFDGSTLSSKYIWLRPNTSRSISYEDNGNEPYDVFLTYLLREKTKDLPQVLTTSYGEDEDTVPINYARRVCKLYAALGTRGVSALHASGDGGVGRVGETGACFTPNRFVPIFPVVLLEASRLTYQIPGTTVRSSGGGFSDYFPRPWYQHRAVPRYLKTLGSTYEGLFNKNGRAYPDVAAQGYRYLIVYQGKVIRVSGTSASTPTFAAIIALLNDALLSKGRRPLGFLNPWIYSLKPGILNDITTGSNPGCGTTGFNATRGWDPATGFGTPDLPRLLKALKL